MICEECDEECGEIEDGICDDCAAMMYPEDWEDYE